MYWGTISVILDVWKRPIAFINKIQFSIPRMLSYYDRNWPWRMVKWQVSNFDDDNKFWSELINLWNFTKAEIQCERRCILAPPSLTSQTTQITHIICLCVCTCIHRSTSLVKCFLRLADRIKNIFVLILFFFQKRLGWLACYSINHKNVDKLFIWLLNWATFMTLPTVKFEMLMEILVKTMFLMIIEL